MEPRQSERSSGGVEHEPPAAVDLDTPASLLVTELVVQHLRNLTRVELSPASRLNVLSGDNGQGKTSLLEAIYFVATSRSFRTAKLGELVQHDHPAGSVRATFRRSDDELTRTQTAAIDGTRAVVRLDGERPKTLAHYATRSPVVVFHPDEMALSSGSAQVRRRLVDRIALFVDPKSADTRARYTRALRERQECLRRGRPALSQEAALEAYEELCARHGAELTAIRGRTVALLTGALLTAFASISSPELRLHAAYAPGGSEDFDAARAALRAGRARDAHRPTAGFGPHRDDLALSLDGRPARVVGSQGQHRAITLALKSAEATCLSGICGVQPILLLDDVSSELDPSRTEALLRFLGATRSQIFLTTTRAELIDNPELSTDHRKDFRVRAGAVESG